MHPQEFAEAGTANPAPAPTSQGRERPHDENGLERQRRGRTIRPRILGDYTLSKTLGKGNSGKVKLATHNITGEKVAIKILPRLYPNPSPQTNGSESSANNNSKEIRTFREAALSTLLYHPYICGMREMLIHEHHYYMVFAYVSGGQMLDYIIKHGRLQEQKARKFARQIGSALEYCHLNNVVHRDLKIENILISKTGNIKIIDFGISNLYDPISHLSTFCGSLYFAAPEMYHTRAYIGPEVDVWSFGVVLYILVCGKVPFEDNTIPALISKIKRGLVEYPVWLSPGCKHLLSQMLVTKPAHRATMAEVMAHPWMVRGYSGPPTIHMSHREPLCADGLNLQVIKGMQGIEFETEDEIKRKLVHIIKSDAYIRAVHHWESHNKFNPSSSPCGNADSAGGKTDLLLAPTKLLRRFDYNRRKPFPQKFLPPDNLPSHPPLNIQHHLTHPPFPDHKRDFLDPTRGFHPLISLYYLTREKIERDSVYGTGQFSNSQLSITGEVANPNAISTPIPADSMPIRQQQLNAASNEPQRPPATVTSVNELTSAKFDYNKPLPRLPAPETSNYSWISYDSTVSPSPTLPTFAQPQARDPGLPPSLHAQPREHIEIAQGELGMKNGARVNGVDEKGVDRLPSAPKSVGHEMTTSSMEKVESSGGAEKSIQTHHDHTSPFPSGAILVPELCNIRDGGRADERRHETMSSKQGTILGVLAPFPSRLAVYFKPELNGTDAPTVDETVPGPCKDDDSTVTTAIMTGLTLPEPNPSTLSPAGDETSSPVPSQAIRNVLRRMDLHFITSEIGREDEPEYFKPNANQTAQPPPQKSECGTAPWILASHQPHAPKKPVDVQFIARMADLRQQTNGTSSTSSTPQARESMALLGSPVSIASSAFSQSFSIASLPPAVEFPPTPVFMDQLLGEFCEPGAPAVSCS